MYRLAQVWVGLGTCLNLPTHYRSAPTECGYTLVKVNLSGKGGGEQESGGGGCEKWFRRIETTRIMTKLKALPF